MDKKREFALIGAPYGFGAGIMGCDLTPKTFREQGLNGLIEMRMRNWSSKYNFSIEDFGDVDIDLTKCESKVMKAQKFCDALEEKIDVAYEHNKIPIVIGGDHTIAVASLASSAKILEKRFGRKKLGVIWVDAHADINAHEQGNVHGKSLAIATGKVFSRVFSESQTTSLKSKNINYIAIRDLMMIEEEIIIKDKIPLYGMHDIDKMGIVEIMKRILEKLENECDGIYLSFDIDSCDGLLYPGSGTPEMGGLTAREACYITECVARSPKFLGMDLVELNIARDPQGTTKELALKLVDAVLGFRFGGRFE